MDAKTHLQEVAQGYQKSVVLLTACRFGVFIALGRDARGVAELAATLEFDARALEAVLLALVAEGFLERSDEGKYSIVPGYADLLLPGTPLSQSCIMSHHYACLQRWAGLAQVLKSGKPIEEYSSEASEEELRNFICGMADISRLSSAEVAEKIDLASFRRMLDLGGGPATSSITFAHRNPLLQCVVFDLERPLEIAREEIAKAGLSERVTTREGDYFRDAFGEGFDLVYISNIIHSVGVEDTAMIAEKSYRALRSGGRLVIKDFFLDDTRTAPAFGAYFSVNMLVATEAGKSYTLSETREILERVGFEDFDTVEVAAASRLLVARKP
jgi:ubiquinone/menaquinone biosynthesis C-methylase UbiE